jgi:hypothetical protein
MKFIYLLTRKVHTKYWHIYGKKGDSDEISYQIQKCTWYYQMRKLRAGKAGMVDACTVRKKEKRGSGPKMGR